MDDRTYRIVAGILALCTVALGLDAAFASFEPPAGLWTVLGAVAAFLGARAALRSDEK